MLPEFIPIISLLPHPSLYSRPAPEATQSATPAALPGFPAQSRRQGICGRKNQFRPPLRRPPLLQAHHDIESDITRARVFFSGQVSSTYQCLRQIRKNAQAISHVCRDESSKCAGSYNRWLIACEYPMIHGYSLAARRPSIRIRSRHVHAPARPMPSPNPSPNSDQCLDPNHRPISLLNTLCVTCKRLLHTPSHRVVHVRYPRPFKD
jgi:hypothetical protein